MDIKQGIPTNGGDWIQKFGEAWKKQVERLKCQFADGIEEVRMPPEYCTDVPIVYVKKEAILEVLRFMKETPEFEYNFLSDITATDEIEDGVSESRFQVVYNLFSIHHFWRIRVKVKVGENEEVPSAVSLWKSANWAEREVFDMFGVRFKGHPNLRRILMDQRWVGHPLRKDYPLREYQVFTDAQPVDPDLLGL